MHVQFFSAGLTILCKLSNNIRLNIVFTVGSFLFLKKTMHADRNSDKERWNKAALNTCKLVLALIPCLHQTTVKSNVIYISKIYFPQFHYFHYLSHSTAYSTAFAVQAPHCQIVRLGAILLRHSKHNNTTCRYVQLSRL